ncbi:HMG domain-containing protein 3 isoform X1 [Melopsittacus undulatus]|uniref:HMG domain-containing protein 3 isoform X1 n=1 Tax=Melopsittacus undulatus TaxID=13146 RepID=UPI00146D84FA|nr:HMG domain-containing protein 3 isoform X1 [Melopsittacus undulatus]
MRLARSSGAASPAPLRPAWDVTAARCLAHRASPVLPEMEAPYDGTEVTVVMEEIEGTYTYASSPVPSKKKKKYKSTGDHGEKAKKPRSAYLLYYYDIYLKVQQELPHLPQSEINKKISESWRLLSVAEKSYYLEKAKLEKEGLDPNSKVSTLAAVVPDIPGFRKILPRSDYIIIPKTTLQEERSRQSLELCVTQVQAASEGLRASTNITSVPRDAVQNILPVDSSHVGISQQCITIEGLAEDTASFTQPDALEEGVASEVLSHYVGPVTEKVVGDILLDEASLEIEGQPYQTARVVIEETLVNNSTDMSNGNIAVARPQVSDGVSVVTVVTGRDTEESSSSTPATQFIMLPLPAHSVVENPASIKLTTTYTRRGHGNCTNPGCSFTYVTRHKPPKCPLCGNFLGGKWIPKEKQPKSKSEPNSGTSLKTPAAKRGQQSVFTEPAAVSESTSKSALESSEAVSQLLNAVPVGEHMQELEWEEVIVSEAHVLANNVLAEDGLGATGVVLSQESQKQGESSTEQAEKDSGIPIPTLSSEVPCLNGSAKKPVGIDAPTPTHKGQEVKSKPRPKPSLLAAARPMRAILPAPASVGREASTEQSSNRQAFGNADKHSPVRTSGLKPSTLKQLGQSVLQPPSAEERKLHSALTTRASQVEVVEVKPDIFPSYKYSCTVTLDLGLATSRGRGKCKNPSCSYVYTNRHKPRICPSCGYNLAKDRAEKTAKSLVSPGQSDVLNTSEPLTPSQKEIQRQSTLQLLRKVMQIPENESELAEVFTLIQELNSSRLILSNVSEETVTIEQTSWSNYYESPSAQCLLCNSPLFKGGQNSLAGPQECWLLTANRLQVVTAQVKVCLNLQCLALHSFTDIYTGLFNVGNKLLVSLDLLFAIRNHIKLGEDPRVAVGNILDSVQEQTEKSLSPDEQVQLQELLCNGYWAFECLTVRDYNDMICGICGITPKVEIAQRNVENVLALKNIEFTWPEFLPSSEVNVEDFWSTMETEVIEQVAFPSSIPITKFDASIVAPFFPPLMRGAVVVNTEKDKNLDAQRVPGNGSALVRLLQEEILRLELLSSYSEQELQSFLTQCSIPWEPSDTKDQLCYSLLALYEFVQNGTSTTRASAHQTGGKIYKVCPHQVVCGSKYIVRGENARDHVDLLVSSRHWPPVYVVDTASSVALCADVCCSSLTSQMWGKNQGCFSDPMDPPTYVSCPELLDQHYSVDMTVAEHSVQHPITKSATRRIVHTGLEQNSSQDPTAQHHCMSLCRELEPYSAIIAAINDSKTSNVRQKPITFENATHYYLYNRLMDFLTSREIVNRQIQEIVQSCQPGEVVIRDALYRLGVAQIKTETEEDEEGKQEDDRGC